MKKEEIVESLNTILESLSYDALTKTPEEINSEREHEIDQIDQQKDNLLIQIKELEEKLSNDDNYIGFTYMRNQARIYDAGVNVDKYTEKIAENNAAMKRDSQRLTVLDTEIETCNSLLSDTQNRLEETSKEYRALGENVSDEVSEEYRVKLNSIREDIEYLQDELKMFKEEKEELTSALEQYEKNAEIFNERKERYTKIANAANEREENSKSNNVDKNKKSADENYLSQLKAALVSFDSRKAYLSFDFVNEVAALATDIQEDKIDEVEMLNRLKEIQKNMPEQYSSKDYTNYEEEIEKNHSLQSELIDEKVRLETRLSDEVNYTPSILAVEVMNQEVSDLESRIASYDATIATDDASLIRYENQKKSNEKDIETFRESIVNLENENQRLMLEIFNKRSTMTDKEVDDINKAKKKNTKEIERANKQIENLTKNSSMIDFSIMIIKKKRKELESIKSKEIKQLESKQASLTDRTTIDRVALAADKNRLEEVTAQIALLEKGEKATEFDYQTEISNLIAGVQKEVDNKPVTKEEDIVVPLVNDMEEEAVEEKDDEDVIVPIVNNKIEDTEPNTIESNDDPMDISEDDIVPVPGLLAKLKDKKFLKKVAKAIIGLITLALLSAGLAKCSNSNRKYKEPLANGTVIEDWNDDNIEVDDSKLDQIIEEVLDKEQVEVTPTPTPIEEEVKDEQKEEEKTDDKIDDKKTIDEVAWEVIRGDWGNGEDRKNRLEDAGYDYQEVQDRVNELLKDLDKTDNKQEDNDNQEKPVETEEETKDEQKEEEKTETDKDFPTDIPSVDDPVIENPDVEVEPENPDVQVEPENPIVPEQPIIPSNPVIPDTPIVTPTPTPQTENVTQEIEEGQVGILVTGNDEQHVSVTDNIASQPVLDAANEIVDKYQEMTGTQATDTWENPDVSNLGYDENGTIHVEAEGQVPDNNSVTLEDAVDAIVEEKYGQDMTDIFNKLNDQMVKEAEEGGRSR